MTAAGIAGSPITGTWLVNHGKVTLVEISRPELRRKPLTPAMISFFATPIETRRVNHRSGHFACQ